MKKMTTLALVAIMARKGCEQTRVHNHQGEPYHQHEGPEPFGYVLGLLYPLFL